MTALRLLLVVAATAVTAFVSAAAPAGAVTLRVNGDTPSIRWQKQVDHYRMPTWPGVAHLYLAEPTLEEDGVIGYPYDGGPPEIYIETDRRSTAAIGWTLRHEVGHGTITWARAVGGWTPADDRAAAARLRVPVGGSETWGLDLDELLADGYAVCTFPPSERRWWLWIQKAYSEAAEEPYALRSTAQVRWICPRLRAAIERAKPRHIADWIPRYAAAATS